MSRRGDKIGGFGCGLYRLASLLRTVAYAAPILPMIGQAADYTKCSVDDPEGSGLDLCLPTANGTTTTLQFVRSHSSIVAVVPVKNCRTAADNVRGGISLAVDSSASMKNTKGEGTDPDGLRLTAAATILRDIQSNAQSQVNNGLITTAHVDFPRVSAISYGGRQSTAVVDSNGNQVYESDGLNAKVTPVYCKAAEGTEEQSYPTSASTRWAQTTSSGSTLISRCELLLPFLANTTSASNSTTPGIERTIDFLTTTGQTPRGATDLTYIFQAFSRSDMLPASTSTARTAILITDGLPNIPKLVPQSACEQKAYLRSAATGVLNGQTYCTDRQFRLAATAADNMLEDYTNYKYNTINLYTILFLGDGKGYIDVDDEGKLNPADFLIEASARTGNGKVKFKLARTAADVSDFIESIYKNTSNTAIQRVEISVNGGQAYTAVSPGAPSKLFSLKFLNLQDGANTVVVTIYYTDQTITKTYTVNVATSGTITSPYDCTTGDGTKTVDGDDLDDKTPKGDGVKPGGGRVYRNEDPENNLNPNDFNLVDTDEDSTRTKIESGQLRLQGGTGNCGVVLGLKNYFSGFGFLLMMLPIAVILLLRRVRKNFLSLFLIGFFLTAVNQNRAEAVGLNSENFLPALGRKSPLLWENSERLGTGGFVYGYTFDYSLHPVEFGDGADERIGVSNHLQVNHFSIGYGALSFLTVGFDVPLSLYSAPDTVDGAIALPKRNRSTFFLGDMGVYAKLAPDFVRNDWVSGALLFHLSLPTGSTEAMLSDDSVKATVFSPWDFQIGEDWEPYIGIGMSVWQTTTRVESEYILDDNSQALLKRSRSLLLNTGLRYWFIKQGENAPGLKFEFGLRGDFQEYSPSLSDQASPVEWAMGGAWYADRNWSFHGSLGSGMGRGVGGPLTRLVAGVRYTDDVDESVIDDEDPDTMLSTESMSEAELEQILSRGQSEAMPPRLEENDSMLRLMTVREEVFDLGTVRFEFDSARLTPEAKRTVRKLYDYLKRLRPRIVRIDGHTDSVGSYNYNLALSMRRALSVKNELVHLGWPGQTISTDGFSYKYPVVSNATREGRAQNRRIEVALDGKSFRKSSYTSDEKRQFREWIAPGGKKPRGPND